MLNVIPCLRYYLCFTHHLKEQSTIFFLTNLLPLFMITLKSLAKIYCKSPFTLTPIINDGVHQHNKLCQHSYVPPNFKKESKA